MWERAAGTYLYRRRCQLLVREGAFGCSIWARIYSNLLCWLYRGFLVQHIMIGARLKLLTPDYLGKVVLCTSLLEHSISGK